MAGNNMSSDEVIAKLIGMGFESSDVEEAIIAVGPNLNDAIEFILNDSRTQTKHASSSFKCSTSNKKAPGRRTLSSSGSLRQLSIMEHFKPAARPKGSRTSFEPDVLVSESEVSPKFGEGPNEALPVLDSNRKPTAETSMPPSFCNRELDKANALLHKHFGYSSLKSFQKEALTAWLAHRDCLVLAATGSGKSLCFQIPALLTGKVVVVVSPLISLMHDQCLKLAKHGVSACFLGSGQSDSSVEQKAMRGMYGIIYVCPETILRLIKPLQSLAENRGIALFAIDEVHCISKWGHDFRPDYRRLSVLRESFSAGNLKFLQFDIPLMALTATATFQVREDILKSLCMSKETNIVITSFFRPNLRFSVNHSRTGSPSSYEKDFWELIDVYTRKEKSSKKKHNIISQDQEDASNNSTSTLYGSIEADNVDGSEDDQSFGSDDEVSLKKGSCPTSSKEKELSVEYLEDECDLFQGVDDWDVPCGEFCGQLPEKHLNMCGSSEKYDLLNIPEERLKLRQLPLEQGSTIIYVPTRKETINIAKFLCRSGVKAAAYNAKLPKSHLRQVHKEFHENVLQVVVATIAFGMGIDKLNVRRIIHYGWPQSLEAYYQEAGRAGRDGKLADCVLYANISRSPTLLPNRRSEEQTKQAYKMLSDCYRYGMATSSCRAKMLVEYFGEQFSYEKCLLCDICVNGPPEKQNLKAEVDIFMQVVATHYAQSNSADGSNDIITYSGNKRKRLMEKPNIRMFVSKIREQFVKFSASDLLWWRGLARILEDKGFIREGDDMTRVQLKFPEPTELGLDFLRCQEEQSFYVFPEADMLLSTRSPKSFSTFSEWGRGWADPEIRRQRLERRRSGRNPRKRRSRKQYPDMTTARGRLAAKLSKHT